MFFVSILPTRISPDLFQQHAGALQDAFHIQAVIVKNLTLRTRNNRPVRKMKTVNRTGTACAYNPRHARTKSTPADMFLQGEDGPTFACGLPYCLFVNGFHTIHVQHAGGHAFFFQLFSRKLGHLHKFPAGNDSQNHSPLAGRPPC